MGLQSNRGAVFNAPCLGNMSTCSRGTKDETRDESAGGGEGLEYELSDFMHLNNQTNSSSYRLDTLFNLNTNASANATGKAHLSTNSIHCTSTYRHERNESQVSLLDMDDESTMASSFSTFKLIRNMSKLHLNSSGPLDVREPNGSDWIGGSDGMDGQNNDSDGRWVEGAHGEFIWLDGPDGDFDRDFAGTAMEAAVSATSLVAGWINENSDSCSGIPSSKENKHVMLNLLLASDPPPAKFISLKRKNKDKLVGSPMDPSGIRVGSADSFIERERNAMIDNSNDLLVIRDSWTRVDDDDESVDRNYGNDDNDAPHPLASMDGVAVDLNSANNIILRSRSEDDEDDYKEVRQEASQDFERGGGQESRQSKDSVDKKEENAEIMKMLVVKCLARNQQNEQLDKNSEQQPRTCRQLEPDGSAFTMREGFSFQMDGPSTSINEFNGSNDIFRSDAASAYPQFTFDDPHYTRGTISSGEPENDWERKSVSRMDPPDWNTNRDPTEFVIPHGLSSSPRSHRTFFVKKGELCPFSGAHTLNSLGYPSSPRSLTSSVQRKQKSLSHSAFSPQSSGSPIGFGHPASPRSPASLELGQNEHYRTDSQSTLQWRNDGRTKMFDTNLSTVSTPRPNMVQFPRGPSNIPDCSSSLGSSQLSTDEWLQQQERERAARNHARGSPGNWRRLISECRIIPSETRESVGSQQREKDATIKFEQDGLISHHQHNLVPSGQHREPSGKSDRWHLNTFRDFDCTHKPWEQQDKKEWNSGHYSSLPSSCDTEGSTFFENIDRRMQMTKSNDDMLHYHHGTWRGTIDARSTHNTSGSSVSCVSDGPRDLSGDAIMRRRNFKKELMKQKASHEWAE